MQKERRMEAWPAPRRLSMAQRFMLIVGTEPEIVSAAIDHLEELGYVVHRAPDVPEAIRVLESTRPSSILLSTDSEATSAQLAQAINENGLRVPIVLVAPHASK